MKFVFNIGIYGPASSQEDVMRFTYVIEEKNEAFFDIFNDVICKYYSDSYQFFNRVKIITELDVKHPFYIRIVKHDVIKQMFVELLKRLRKDVLLFFDINYVAYVELKRESDSRYYTNIIIE